MTPTKSDQAEASSAHSRINIPLNLENWKDQSDDIQSVLLWFHQHALDNKLSLADAAEALNYDQSTVFRILKGTYEGSWTNIAKAIQSYRKLDEMRGTIQQNEFVENRITEKIFDALDEALASNAIAIIQGESRQGKSVSLEVWRERNNHGRAVKIVAPAFGGTKGLLRAIAMAVGVNKNLDGLSMHSAIMRAFNRNRILIVDEAHRLLPNDRRTNPANVEILRDLHDQTGCALALVATARFHTELVRGEYMFEQLLGRALLTKLPKIIKDSDILPIIRQYIARPGKDLVEGCVTISNGLGRLGVLVECLRSGSRMAKKSGARMTDDHMFKAIARRREFQSTAD
jgi:DNA transposition AAA+ family ATPase